MLPGLKRRYREYVEATDPMLDDPSVMIIERILPELSAGSPTLTLCVELGVGAADGRAPKS